MMRHGAAGAASTRARGSLRSSPTGRAAGAGNARFRAKKKW
ncbi:hypothetical protein HMPREF1868_00967 [Olsenella sp. DNF00959]|nr:hypothetical protein HMPREF1868_00967 [Olsenella sp. DNF00959]